MTVPPQGGREWEASTLTSLTIEHGGVTGRGFRGSLEEVVDAEQDPLPLVERIRNRLLHGGPPHR